MNEIVFEDSSASEISGQLHPTLATVEDDLSVTKAAHDDLVLVARSSDAVVGYLAATSDQLGGLTVWEHVVAPDFRNRGIGRRLLLEAAKRATPMSKVTIDPTGPFEIDAVVQYYERLGYPSTSDDNLHITALAHSVVDAIGEQTEDEATLRSILRRKGGGVISVGAGIPITHAIAVLYERNIGALVVVGEGGETEGLLSDRGILAALHHKGAHALEASVGEFMDADCLSVDISDVVADVMEAMTIRRARHALVTDDGSLTGIVSLGDLLVFRMREHDMRRDRLRLRPAE